MRRFVAGLVLMLALFAAPAALAQQPTSAPEPAGSKPWSRLLFIVPGAALIGFGAYHVRRRTRDDA